MDPPTPPALPLAFILVDLVDSVKEFSMSRFKDSIAAVAGLGNGLSVLVALTDEGRILSSGGKVKPSFILNCSDELVDSFRCFFLRLGGATGPVDVRLSVVFECANLVLAITSGSER